MYRYYFFSDLCYDRGSRLFVLNIFGFWMNDGTHLNKTKIVGEKGMFSCVILVVYLNKDRPSMRFFIRLLCTPLFLFFFKISFFWKRS